MLILWVFFYFYFLVQASCTLEAGVKIYSLRVDSVHSEAYKVLGGINRAGREEDTGLGYGFFFFKINLPFHDLLFEINHDFHHCVKCVRRYLFGINMLKGAHFSATSFLDPLEIHCPSNI